MYSSYFLLFSRLFYDKYVAAKETKKDALKAAGKDEDAKKKRAPHAMSTRSATRARDTPAVVKKDTKKDKTKWREERFVFFSLFQIDFQIYLKMVKFW